MVLTTRCWYLAMYTHGKQIYIDGLVGVAIRKQTQERDLYRWKWLRASYKSAACEYSLAYCSCSSSACIKTHLCPPLCSIPFSTTPLVTNCSTHVMASLRYLGKCSASRGFLCYCLLGMLTTVFEVAGNEA